MGVIVMPGQEAPRREPVEDVIYKIVFEPVGDNGEPFSLFENLNFETTDDGLLVSVADKPQRREIIELLGNMVDPRYYWDADSGSLVRGRHKPVGFYALGRYAPGTSLLSMLDVLDPGKEFQYAGAGKETVGKALREWHQAYGPGHETMLRSLMNIPAIARMVKGHDPSNGKDNTRNAHIVQDVLRQHKKDFGAEYVTGRDERGRKVAHNTAFDTLPKLMAFIANVNEAFNEKRGDKNPLFDLLSSDSLDTHILEEGGNTGQLRVGLRRKDGESDEDFYRRQLEDINRHRRDERKTAPLTYEQYYNWVIDRMVRNIDNAAKALAGREAELDAARKGGLKLIRTGEHGNLTALENKIKGIRGKYKDDFKYMLVAGKKMEWLRGRINAVNQAIASALEWEKGASMDDRKAVLADRRGKAEKMWEFMQAQHQSQARLSDAERAVEHYTQLLKGEEKRASGKYSEKVSSLEKKLEELKSEAARFDTEYADSKSEYNVELGSLCNKYGVEPGSRPAQNAAEFDMELDELNGRYALVEAEFRRRADALREDAKATRQELESARRGKPNLDSKMHSYLVQKKAEAEKGLEAAKAEMQGEDALSRRNAAKRLGHALTIRNAIVRRTDEYLQSMDGRPRAKPSGYSSEKREEAERMYRRVERKIASAQDEEEYLAAHGEGDSDAERLDELRKALKKLFRKRTELESSLFQLSRSSAPPDEGSGAGGKKFFMITFLEKYKSEQEEKLKELEKSGDYIKYGEYMKEAGPLKKELDARRKESHSYMTANPKTYARMYQMAIDRNSVLTLDQLMENGGDLSPLANGSMKIVSAGILLGNTGMDLKQVRQACRKYFNLRTRMSAKARDSAQLFEEVFGVSPMRIPSDERIKDFHRGWKRIGEARDTQRNIIDAVHRRFF